MCVAILLAGSTSAALAQEVRPVEPIPPRVPTGEPQGFLREPGHIERISIFFDRKLGNGELAEGWYYGQGALIPGAGWPSAGVGYRKWYGTDTVVAEASGAISWRGYKAAHLRFELPNLNRRRLAVGSQVRVQDFGQVAHFGEGPDSAASHRTEYDLESLNAVGYATFRPIRWLGIGASAGWLDTSLGPPFLHSEASLTADTRDFAGHPTRGGLYRVSAAHFSDRDTGAFSFRRNEAEAAQFLPLADSRIVLALHGWLAGSDAGEGRIVPFYLQPSLGGHNSLRGYADYRFHDRSMLLVNVEARMAMMTHVDAAVFMDAGNVASRVRDLDLAKRSYGVGLRLHSRRQTLLRVDAARGDEGWRIFLRLDDPLDLARLAKRTALVPFVH